MGDVQAYRGRSGPGFVCLSWCPHPAGVASVVVRCEAVFTCLLSSQEPRASQRVRRDGETEAGLEKMSGQPERPVLSSLNPNKVLFSAVLHQLPEL